MLNFVEQYLGVKGLTMYYGACMISIYLLSVKEIFLIFALLFYRFRTGSRFSVRVSAVEIVGRSEKVRDLLAEQASGNKNKLSMNDKCKSKKLTKCADGDRESNLLSYSDVTQAQRMAQVTQAPAFSSVRTATELR